MLAEAPKALEAYDVLGGLFKGSSLTTTEQHVVLLTINYENNCGYCMPAHTLRTFTVQVVQKHGWVADGDVQAFLDAGYTRQQILEVIVGMSYKVISNYTNHIADTPVDTAFKKFAWEKPAGDEAA